MSSRNITDSGNKSIDNPSGIKILECINSTCGKTTFYKFLQKIYLWSHRLVVRTPASHAGNAGSTPAGITKQ